MLTFEKWESITMGELFEMVEKLYEEEKLELKIGELSITVTYTAETGFLRSRSSNGEICESTDALFNGEVLDSLFKHLAIMTDM